MYSESICTSSELLSLPKIGFNSCVILGNFSWRRKDIRIFSKKICCSAQPSQGPPPAWPGRAVAEPGHKTWDGQKPIAIVGSTGSIGTQVIIMIFSMKELTSETS